MLRSNVWICGACACGIALLGATPAGAAKTHVYTNQSYIEDAQNPPDVDIKDIKAVLALVLDSLPETVTVYPTENYFYFYFYHRGIRYGGNLRFDVADRDKGLVHFNYFKDFTDWQRDESGFSALYGAKDGVMLKSAGKLAYDLEFNGKKVRFLLNDLSAVKPPPGAVQTGETYIGPVFDESGMRFFLLFNPEEKIFLYVLDETTPPPEQFNAAAPADRISIGIRTGFAFYADRFANRKILVGVHQINTAINNYLDGPFDQLPDNFLEGEALRSAILAASPEMDGKIDRFGNSPDGETRYLIAPYMQYQDEQELGGISGCAASEARPSYYHCFSFADTPADDTSAVDDTSAADDTSVEDDATDAADDRQVPEKPADN